MATRVVVLVAAALITCACGNDARRDTPTATAPIPTSPTPPATSPSLVQGIVLDFQTARPIAGAVVAFSTSAGLSVLPAGTETAVTDANGRYSLPEPALAVNGQAPRRYFYINDEYVGSGYPRASNYRADVALDRGKCVARYGMVLDSRTLRPVVGATAHSLTNTLRATTDRDGWYHIDWGCGVGSVGFNTTWHVMSHPDYTSANFAGGRGINGTYREDVLLTPK